MRFTAFSSLPSLRSNSATPAVPFHPHAATVTTVTVVGDTVYNLLFPACQIKNAPCTTSCCFPGIYIGYKQSSPGRLIQCCRVVIVCWMHPLTESSFFFHPHPPDDALRQFFCTFGETIKSEPPHQFKQKPDINVMFQRAPFSNKTGIKFTIYITTKTTFI